MAIIDEAPELIHPGVVDAFGGGLPEYFGHKEISFLLSDLSNDTDQNVGAGLLANAVGQFQMC
jgi:hypothetical protein